MGPTKHGSTHQRTQRTVWLHAVQSLSCPTAWVPRVEEQGPGWSQSVVAPGRCRTKAWRMSALFAASREQNHSRLEACAIHDVILSKTTWCCICNVSPIVFHPPPFL